MRKKFVFLRLWFYLICYKVIFFLVIFLKVLFSFMSVLEFFILGLVIIELIVNFVDMVKGVFGVELNVFYIVGILIIYFFRGVFYELGFYGLNYFMIIVV